MKFTGIVPPLSLDVRVSVCCGVHAAMTSSSEILNVAPLSFAASA